MALKDGDIVLVNYTVRSEDGVLVETTIEDIARKEGKYSEDTYYGPKPIVVDERTLVKGFYKALKDMNVGDKKTAEIPPEEAYGVIDPAKIRKYPIRRFLKAGVRPEVGKVVEINNELGIIKRVTDRIVEVDFNHPLAGKKLVYEIEVIDIADTPEKKVKYLVARRLTINPDEVEVDAGDGVFRVKLKPNVMDIRDLPLYLKVLGAEVKKFLPETRRLEFIISIEYPAPQEEGKEEAENKEEASQ